MSCSWSTMFNPLNMVRALWDLVVYCCRSFRAFWIRLTSSRRAPTVQNIVAFQNQTTEGGKELQRQFSLQAHQGSVSSSNQDSAISDRSPTDTFSIPESISQISHFTMPSSSEQIDTGSEHMHRVVHSGLQQDTPFLHRRESQRSHERPSVFEGSSSQGSDSSENSYNTFM